MLAEAHLSSRRRASQLVCFAQPRRNTADEFEPAEGVHDNTLLYLYIYLSRRVFVWAQQKCAGYASEQGASWRKSRLVKCERTASFVLSQLATKWEGAISPSAKRRKASHLATEVKSEPGNRNRN